ncbi:SIR2 family NAD-dependent protein deacylase [Ancylobacter sp. SL191]|uniref:SIR2 family NAD-dependent protein deacylase n=1 Tax=Ancylobacter sp. SL191 TaxID=2995166 RepID=UPI0022711B0A|nr:SIR2 family protein [Ancylobacter sp. SL191]WAC29243.1 SIR2 family protein [Ancylobacter sp. SL191]
MRLAEEFRSGLGDAALTDFLRRRIRDDAFEPGQIHRDLLDLPWADVLTTNYDTLLERAVKDSRRSYDPVLRESDLAHAIGARIIKLHGSLRDPTSIVISEEHYRTYPERHAAFVNTARQLFIENELCLLGFSGDDPNFLQWAGWVRDRLGGSARRIYLVGALDLPPVKRRLLEARGVAPIDLAPAVSGERDDRRHAVAISLFLAHLKDARPTEPDDWVPISSGNYPRLGGNDIHARQNDFRNSSKVVEAFRSALDKWKSDRKACPDWLICPQEVRIALRHGTTAVENLPLALDTLPESERQEALLELAWRYDRGSQPLSPWLTERMHAIFTQGSLSDAEPSSIGALARTLLGAARAADDESAFASCAARFEALTVPEDLPAIVMYERCLFARDRLDFAFVAENLTKIDGDDPVWGLRRAALLYWVGDTEGAQRTVGAAARDLRTRVLRDPDSIALRSRLAWAKMLVRSLRWEDDGALFAELNGLDRLAMRDYDPWAELRALESEVEAGLRKRLEARQIEPSFDTGAYRDNRNTLKFGNAAGVTPLSELRHLAETAGLPIRTRHVNLLGTSLADALRLAFEPTAAWYSAFLATRPSHSKGPIEIHLGRIPIARLGLEAVVELRKRLEHAVTYWHARVRKRFDSIGDIDALRLYVEALSRVTAIDDADTAKAHARLAVEMGSDEALNHWWLNEPIGNLLKRSLDAVPSSERAELSSELLKFPMAVEKDAGGPSMSWYNPGPDAYRFVRRSESEAIFDTRVAAFLQHLAPGGLSRAEATIRLFYLYENGQLSSSQISSFAAALWEGVPETGTALPKGTNLFSHAFLSAPAPPNIDVHSRVYAHLFAADGSESKADPEELVATVSGRRNHLRPNENDAARLFDNVTKWRPERLPRDPIDEVLSRGIQEKGDKMMASVLGMVAAPALAHHDRTVERAKAALAFMRETELPETLAAFPVFYGLDTDVDLEIANAFRRVLATGDRRATPAAVTAIDLWLRLSEAGEASPLPDVLRNRALRALERGRIGGLASLIYLARRLIVAGCCGDPELDQIVEVLDELRVGTDYGSPDGDIDFESDRAVSLPLIRAECVRLAQALEAEGVATEPVRIWRDVAASDPLPEVRYAARRVVDA